MRKSIVEMRSLSFYRKLSLQRFHRWPQTLTHTHTCVPAFGTVLHCTPCSCRSAAAPAGVLPLKYVVVIRHDVLMRMFSAVSRVWKPALKWHEPQQTCCLITGCHFLLPTVAPILMLLSLMLRLPHYFNTKHAAQRWTQFVILCLFFVSNFIFHFATF